MRSPVPDSERSDGRRITEAYRRFAAEEARSRSPLYEELSLSVAADPELIGFLASLPREKQQPNLLLGAVRLLFGTARDKVHFRTLILDNPDALRLVMLARSTQTNEPGRCATLLPILAKFPQPLALIEVGASAGLCLLPDLYAYDYGGRIVAPDPAPAEPVFPCAADDRTPIPHRLPEIAWRAGLDLEPIDLSDPDQVAWLEALVWPEETDRLARLRAAMRIAASARPDVIRGDLLRDLGPLAAEAPRDATLVIFHTAVLTYVAPPQRAEFARAVASLCDFWVANEAPRVLPEIAERAGGFGPRGRYLTSVNAEPVARADFHGAWMEWLADPPEAYRRRPS
jgi:hypothetical protein